MAEHVDDEHRISLGNSDDILEDGISEILDFHPTMGGLHGLHRGARHSIHTGMATAGDIEDLRDLSGLVTRRRGRSLSEPKVEPLYARTSLFASDMKKIKQPKQAFMRDKKDRQQLSYEMTSSLKETRRFRLTNQTSPPARLPHSRITFSRDVVDSDYKDWSHSLEASSGTHGGDGGHMEGTELGKSHGTNPMASTFALSTTIKRPPHLANRPRKSSILLKQRSSKPVTKAYRNVTSHQDLHEQYNFKAVKHERREMAALLAQSYIRGFLERYRMNKLKERVLLRHTGTWAKFVRDYKSLVYRIQKRYFVKRPETPFNVKVVNLFLDRKEKYEHVFFDMAVADKLPRHQLMKYFNACGMKPTDKEINLAFQAVFRGCSSKAEIVFVVDCSSSLSQENFHLQASFVREVVESLHVSEEHVRVGYVPYNTDVFEAFGLDQFTCRQEVANGIEHVKYKKGITRTDLALKRMREIFKSARPGVPKTAVVITDGASYASYATEKQADLARKEDIAIHAVGVGKNVERKEIFTIAKDRGHVFFLDNYGQLMAMKAQVMKKANFANCRYCEEGFPPDLETDTRGLYKDEALEVVWMVYPPRATGLDPLRRARWMKCEETGAKFIDPDNIKTVEEFLALHSGPDGALRYGTARALAACRQQAEPSRSSEHSRSSHSKGLGIKQDRSEDSTCLRYIVLNKLDKLEDKDKRKPHQATRRASRDVQLIKTAHWNKDIGQALNYVSEQIEKDERAKTKMAAKQKMHNANL